MAHQLSLHRVHAALEELMTQIREEKAINEYERTKATLFLEGVQKTLRAFCLSETGEFDQDFMPGPNVKP